MINQSVRMGYMNIPIDYVRELKSVGNRAKARAFFEYYDDYEISAVNSFGFYANSWGISKTQVQAWIKEFKSEIERYFSYWLIKNSQHYSSVQKATDRLATDHRPIDTLKTTIESGLEKSDRPTTDRPPTEVFNINNNTNGRVNFYDKDFEDLYLRAKYSYKFAGNKEDAYVEYITNHTHINHGDMAFAYMLHVNDPQCKGRFYNLANFMKNQIYIAYLIPRIQVFKDGQIIEGWYDKEAQRLETDNGGWVLTTERFREKVTKGEIIILNKMKAAV